MNSKNNNLLSAVIIPVYKKYKKLSRYEKMSLFQCVKLLGMYDIFLIKPQALSIHEYIFNYTNFKIEPFDNHFFQNIAGYNALMLSDEFYRRFLDYKYILIYQLDAFVFTDELTKWCREGFDYIGAPWLINMAHFSEVEKENFLQQANDAYRHNKRQHESIKPSISQLYNKVGNGGFSLRNCKKFYEISFNMKSEVDHFLNKQDHGHYFNEDVFWSLEVNRNETLLNIPDFKKACQFSLENNPLVGFEYNNGEYPFGCHAWSKFPVLWYQIFKQAGVDINVDNGLTR